MWTALARTFPDALACCLMGNHFHLLVQREPASALRGVRRLLGSQPGWWEVPREAKVLADTREKVRRELRYIALNPCRARLTSDPLAWTWSTHRDLVGASVDPWVKPDRLAWLGSPRELHAYVSSDPSVQVDGTPFPSIHAAPFFHGLGDIARAALASTRSGEQALWRRGLPRTVFFQLARREGFSRAKPLADLLRCHRSSVYRAWAAPDRSGPAKLCLHDARLRAPQTA